MTIDADNRSRDISRLSPHIANTQPAGHGHRLDGAEAATALLTVAEVALTLRVSERAVRRWIAEQRLPAVHLGRAVRIRPADLARLIAVGRMGG